MHKTLAACQSNYIPWKGYFDLIGLADEFVLYDDVQYTRRDWRNRNRIKTPDGPIWLTIPVRSHGRGLPRICDVVVDHPGWARRHWRSIEVNYARAPHFAGYRDFFEELYRGAAPLRLLSEVNHHFLTALCGLLGIDTPLTWVMDFELAETDRVGRIVEMCRAAGADRYLVGPSAAGYLTAEPFAAAGITLEFMDYGAYLPYEQVHPPFVHEVSVVDLVLSCGPGAAAHLLSSQREAAEASDS